MTAISGNAQIVEHKHRWGKYLLRMAWVIEINAALLGLAIAFLMSYQTYMVFTEEFGEFPVVRYFDLILAGLPFVMVAAVEILKIPLCFVVYINTGFKVRCIFTLVLVAITVITFETLATGFERQFYNISTNVDIPKEKLVSLTQNIQFQNNQLERKNIISLASITQEVESRTQTAKKNKNEAVESMKQQIDEYLDLGGGTLSTQKEQQELQLERLVDERQERIAKIEKQAMATRDSKQKDIQIIKEQRDEDVANAKELSGTEKTRVEEEIQKIDLALEKSINNKKEYFVGVMEAESQNQAAMIIANNERIDQLRKSIDEKRKRIDVALDDQGILDFLKGTEDKLNEEIARKEKEIDELLKQNATFEQTSEIALNLAIQQLIDQAASDKKRVRDEANIFGIGDMQKILDLAKSNVQILEDEISAINKDEIEMIAKTETNFEEQRKQIYERIDEIVRQQNLATQYTNEIRHLEEQIANRRIEYTNDIKEIDKYRQSEINKLSQLDKEKDDILAILNNLEHEELILRQEIEKAYQNTQIYRVAKWWYDIEDGHIVKDWQINNIVQVWYGSLAFVVATMGTFLAFGAFILKYSGPEYKDFRSAGGSGPIGRALRKTLAARRKKYNEPKIKEIVSEVEVEVERVVEKEVEVEKVVEKEVIKEVPVEKIVTVDKEVVVEVPKIVEVPVPVEVVKKEVVHYPIFTNDPDYLKFSKTKFTDLVGNDTTKKKDDE